MTTLVVVDYGMGNVRSVAKALEQVAPHAQVVVSGQIHDIQRADRLVLPGQGGMPDCMRHLDAAQLRAPLLAALRTKPVLGICVGEQMLFERSAEGEVPCLGVWPGRVERFAPHQDGPDGARLKVPHMGWNTVRQVQDHPLWAGIPQAVAFYFVHSYFVVPRDPALTVAVTEHGVRFTSAVARDNIFATQFHPEKSAAHGLRLLQNFVTWQP